jgi:hypothetical protein
MSYIKSIFNKDDKKVSISDLVGFFSIEQEETNVLEFKSGEVEINDIFTEVAAFLNTEGGLLIIGSPREKTVPFGRLTKKICQGDLTYSKFRSKDWLYQKLMSNISPPPMGLWIDDPNDEKGTVYVIDIPQSSTPPHQCNSDGRYYIRLDREARPAPHGIVKALFNKRRQPRLEAYLSIDKKDAISDIVNVSFTNKSNIPAEKVGYIIEAYYVSDLLCDVNVSIGQDSFGRKFSITDTIDRTVVQVIRYSLDFLIHHRNMEYMIFVGYWSKENDFDFQYWTYNPQKQEIVATDNMKNQKCSFENELNRLKDLHKE